MLPVKLTIEGLYAYKTRQTIDFQNLTKDHLFGIFGSVGSGKSSILDAITFALYGRLERINQKDGLNKNIFNQASQEFLIGFEFESGEENQRYRFVVKNGRKKNGEPRTFERFAYLWKLNEWLPLERADASDIFQLSYDNFKRTIIIPQGQFSDFLQLTGGERTDMMVELFPKLGEFDFSQKVASLQSINKDQLNTILGQLMELGGAGEGEIEAKRAEIQESEINLEIARTNLVEAEVGFQAINDLKKLFQELEIKRENALKLELERPRFETEKANLDRYQLIYRVFDSDLKLWDNATKKLRESEIQFSEIQKKLGFQAEVVKTALPILQSIEKEAIQIPDWELEISDLKLISECLKLKLQSENYKLELEKIQSILLQLDGDKIQIKNELNSEKERLEKLEANQEDQTQILTAIQFFKDKNRLNDEVEKIGQAGKEIKRRILELRNEKDKVLENSLFKRIPEIKGDTKIKDVLSLLELEKEKLANELVLIQNQILHLGKKEQLFQFSNQMADGEPCPLCGSMHHPEIVSVDDVSKLQQEAHEENIKISSLNNQLTILVQQLREIYTKLIFEDGLEKANAFEIKAKIESIENLISNSSANPYLQMEHGQVQSMLKELEEKQKHILSSRNSIKKLEIRISESELKIDPLLKNQDSILQTLAGIDGQILSFKNQIKQFGENAPDNIPELESRIQGLNIKLEVTKSNLESQILLVQKADRELTILKTTFESQKEIREKLIKEESELEYIINQKIQTEKAGSLVEIRAVLSTAINFEEVSTRINLFFNRLSFANSELAGLVEKTKNQIFKESDWADSNKHLQTIKLAFSTIQGNQAVLKSQLQQLEQRIVKFEKLNIEKEKLEIRQTNLALLSSLFKGKDFVNYVSSVYLKNVVEIANQRFFRLTKQKLRLVLDGENNFYVKDFLNDGHERLAKTLSGGQVFQASLSLALALADTVRHKTKSERNFFFLDEGFGSLDKEALHLVFDTLRQLKHENRIVGVISHIEEMQLEIDNCLKIIMDEEKGSLIEASN